MNLLKFYSVSIGYIQYDTFQKLDIFRTIESLHPI